MSKLSPDEWTPPTWHPDFGNAEEELGMLKRFCIELIQRHPEYAVQLVDLEEGYMYVDILAEGNIKIGELWIVTKDGKKRYGLFLSRDDEEENYFDDVDKGLMHLDHRVGP